jgi:hypothetical protein
VVISLNCLGRAEPDDLRSVLPALDLGDVLARLPEWTRVHLSSVTVESLAQTLELLHSDERPFASDEELVPAAAAL